MGAAGSAAARRGTAPLRGAGGGRPLRGRPCPRAEGALSVKPITAATPKRPNDARFPSPDRTLPLDPGREYLGRAAVHLHPADRLPPPLRLVRHRVRL